MVTRIPEQVLLDAYRRGRFPMCHEDGELYWHDPDPRAVFPVEKLRPNDRLQRALRRAGFRISKDRAFEKVVRACAEREETWIDERIIASFIALHASGHAHAVEVWEDHELVGGIYGLSLGGAFFGESLFSRRDHAGKAAFYALAAHLQHCGHVLFDTQYLNPFTAQLGAVEIPRSSFLKLLHDALDLDVRF